MLSKVVCVNDKKMIGIACVAFDRDMRQDVFLPAEVEVDRLCVCRRHCVQAEGLSGLYSLSAAERCHAGPGGESEDHPRGSGRMSGSLQQLRFPLPEPGSMRGETRQLFLQLQPICLHWSLLRQRYARFVIWFRCCMLYNVVAMSQIVLTFQHLDPKNLHR